MISINLSSHQGSGGTACKDRSERRYRKLRRKSAARLEEYRRLILDIRHLIPFLIASFNSKEQASNGR